MFMFDFFEIIFPLMFILVIGIFIYVFVSNISQWHKNNNSPVIDTDARIVAKRQHRSSHPSGTDNMMHTSTSYYVTFEFNSGDRLELRVKGSEYGLLAEGDVGRLTFQGTRYLGFERIKNV